MNCNEIIIPRDAGGKKINERGMADKILQDHRLVYCQGVMYRYVPAEEVFKVQSRNQIMVLIGNAFNEYARDTNIENLDALLTQNALDGIWKWLCALSEDNAAFAGKRFLYHCRNGVLCLEGNKIILKKGSPDFRSRWRSEISYNPQSVPRRFLQDFLGTALSEDQISQLQLYLGQCLYGKNKSQTFLLLTGTAGSGKSTLATLVENLIGRPNFGSLRLGHTNGRFELGRLVGRNLITAKDVPPDFLSQNSGANLKALTGHDFMEVEFKNSNERPEIRGDFNVIISSNSILRLKIASDIEAWRRRLVWIDYRKATVAKKIEGFERILLQEEGSGILNWAIQGLIKLIDAGWQMPRSPEQNRQIDFLLKSSDPVRVFVKNFIGISATGDLATDEILIAYNLVSEHYRWDSFTRRMVALQLKALLPELHGATATNTVRRNGKRLRGYIGVRLRLPSDFEEKIKNKQSVHA